MVQSEASSSSSSQPDPLDLATATFTCQEPSCTADPLFGWEDIAQHYFRFDWNDFDHTGLYFRRAKYYLDSAPSPPKLGFSARESEIAGAVVRAAGLDDRVATVSDMDAKDLRFGCSVCPPQGDGGSSWTKVGYKWPEIVCSLPLDVFLFIPTVIWSLLDFTLW